MFGGPSWQPAVPWASTYDPLEKRRKRKSLSEVYLATLLDRFDRHLTLKDVVSSFYKNPQFPLVPSLDEIRRTLFALIQEPGHDGEGSSGWELVDSAGTPFSPNSPAQLAISSIQQQLRRAQPESQTDREPERAGGEFIEPSNADETSEEQPETPRADQRKGPFDNE